MIVIQSIQKSFWLGGVEIKYGINILENSIYDNLYNKYKKDFDSLIKNKVLEIKKEENVSKDNFRRKRIKKTD